MPDTNPELSRSKRSPRRTGAAFCKKWMDAELRTLGYDKQNLNSRVLEGYCVQRTKGDNLKHTDNAPPTTRTKHCLIGARIVTHHIVWKVWKFSAFMQDLHCIRDMVAWVGLKCVSRFQSNQEICDDFAAKQNNLFKKNFAFFCAAHAFFRSFGTKEFFVEETRKETCNNEKQRKKRKKKQQLARRNVPLVHTHLCYFDKSWKKTNEMCVSRGGHKTALRLFSK